MNSLKWVLASSLVVAWCSALWADVAPYRRQENEKVTAEVAVKYGGLRGQPRNVQARIIIPSYLVNSGRDVGKIAPKEGAKPEGAPQTPAPKEAPPGEEAKQSSLPPLGTIIAGLAMSLAAVSVVFLVRGKRATKTAAVVALVAAGALGGWSIAQADVVRPGAGGEPIIVIELSDDAEIVTLYLK